MIPCAAPRACGNASGGRWGAPDQLAVAWHALCSLASILWAVVVVAVVLWLIGLVADIAGDLIHLLLILALIALAYNVIAGRRGV